MYLGIELFAETFVSVTFDSFLKSKILVDNVKLEQSIGYDYFELNSVILKDRRASGSGRKCTNKLTDLTSGLGTLSIPPAKPVFLKDGFQKVELVLITNLFKEPGMLKEKLGIRLVSKEYCGPVIPLKTPVLQIEEINGQTIRIDITELVREMVAKQKIC
ncbi:MAG: hypothetical protein PWQ67_1866 [Clostridia bacterium]|nr:hypothetical protein [Clostridia bacterium]MDN5323412.1 hypothetical protein [Clostridia bacterium]